MKKILLFIFFAVSFAMNAQTIQSVDPNIGNLGQTLQVTITGDNTNFLQVSDTYNVSFFNSLQQQLIVNSIDMISDTELIAEVTVPPTVSLGLYNLYIDTWGSAALLSNAFTVTTTYNSIEGNIRFDSNGNGCEASDPPAEGVKVVLNDGTSDRISYTNSLGNYLFYVPAGNYVLTPQLDSPLFSIAPGSASFSFATDNNLIETQDFCLTPIGTHNDLVIAILPLTPARPGFDATYRLAYENAGNQTLSGTIDFTFDDSRLDFISASVTPISQTPGNLSWGFTNLLPFESRTIDFALNVNSPVEAPPVNNDDILPFGATINPILGDDMPNDNNAMFNQVVVGSYDPNDKAVTEGSQIDISEIGNYLHYLIRFQNSGTFAAEKVVVKDVLASTLDPSTLAIISASHPYRTTLTADNKLEFVFDNINLPSEDVDEPGSHGFVAFKIKPSNTVGIGSSIENTAEIYFDFNFPIVTNPVATTVGVLRNTQFEAGDSILLYPNPVGDVLNVETQSPFETLSVQIFNQLGQLVKTANDIGTSHTNTIAVGDLRTGTYFVQITTQNGTSIQKLMKH